MNFAFKSDRPRIFHTCFQLSNHKLIIKGIHHLETLFFIIPNKNSVDLFKKNQSKTYLNRDGQPHVQCESYQLCNPWMRLNGLVLMGRLLGKPWPYHDDVRHAFLGRMPLNHGEEPRIYGETEMKQAQQVLIILRLCSHLLRNFPKIPQLI